MSQNTQEYINRLINKERSGSEYTPLIIGGVAVVSLAVIFGYFWGKKRNLDEN